MVLTNYSTGDKAVYSSFEGGLATDGGRGKMAQLADYPRPMAQSNRAARLPNSAGRDRLRSVVRGGIRWWRQRLKRVTGGLARQARRVNPYSECLAFPARLAQLSCADAGSGILHHHALRCDAQRRAGIHGGQSFESRMIDYRIGLPVAPSSAEITTAKFRSIAVPCSAGAVPCHRR